jgi:hypothetical protein
MFVHSYRSVSVGGVGLVWGYYSAMRTDESGHIFDYTEDRETYFSTKVEFFTDVCEGNCLRGRHENAPVRLVVS